MRKVCERCGGKGRISKLGGVEIVCPACDGMRSFEVEVESKQKSREEKIVETAKKKKAKSKKVKFELAEE